MKPTFNLSLRYKLPIWGALLITITTLAISLALTTGIYSRVRENIAVNALVVAKAVESSLLPALANDDIWIAYQSLAWLAGIRHSTHVATIHPHNLLVVDENQRIVVSTRPKQFRMFAALNEIDPEYRRVAALLPDAPSPDLKEIDLPDTEYFYFVRRLSHDGATLIISYPRQVMTDRFNVIVVRSALTGLLALLLLLPLSWYWGRKISLPLADIAGRIRSLTGVSAPKAGSAARSQQDEVAQLDDAYWWMLKELESKQLLQDQVVRSERLAAVGQLTAGVAHEINNPLSGMLTAIDTLKEYGQGDFRTMKTIGLVERGLLQIKEIVGALLVQANAQGRSLERDDIEDIRVLTKLQADKKRLDFAVTHEMPASVPIPAIAVRQIMINLLLNALQAAPERGSVTLRVAANDTSLEILVCNSGEPIPPDRLPGIFEPFFSKSRAGLGLGLWVTYQIVSQLQGRIQVERQAELTCFSVNLPMVPPP
ncbi:MAG: two-component sensor histidine kinase [Gammaproteobacteria bacterium]|nr:two-component sensor histidine kinase [Rhodocyclaceae bacterium]MBU3908760.1 two-component sensor histidine kinase [Gammaproteobacteria bacterium]MBU3989577.1 two-component sensor histidine kinase [Gammaproteobacteria bacterium]MBU4004788.1 two-component sensor histidine kinase [Gammaproteobacteria bacterium]MBU4021391.1 two-component sensor histidine kinase [Gammaproteobacteria bacterium]